MKYLVFDTIPILAVWPVLVRCQHSVVGILVWIMTKFFCLAYDFVGTPFLNNLVGTPMFLKKGAGSSQIYNTKTTHWVFLWYWYGEYQENTNRYQPKISNQ